MNTEIFRMSARFDATHIPFKGTPEAMTETATGRVDFFFAPLSPALPLIKDGRLQPLAVGTLSRSPLLPDVPTTTEAGFAHSDYVFWVALFAPAATPRAIVERLNAEALKALASAEVRERLAVLGAEPMPMNPRLSTPSSGRGRAHGGRGQGGRHQGAVRLAAPSRSAPRAGAVAASTRPRHLLPAGSPAAVGRAGQGLRRERPEVTSHADAGSVFLCRTSAASSDRARSLRQHRRLPGRAGRGRARVVSGLCASGGGKSAAFD